MLSTLEEAHIISTEVHVKYIQSLILNQYTLFAVEPF